MKGRIIFATLAVTALAMAAQDTFKPIRTYKEGDKDVYELTMKMTAQGSPIDMSMTQTQVVKKVYENGDADIETTVTNSKVNFMGQSRDMPSSPSTTTRMNKFGAPVGKPAGGSRGMNFSFMNFSRSYGDKEMKVGETVKFNWADEKDAKSKAAGTATLVSLTDKTAVVKSEVDVWSAETGDTPIHVVSTVTVDRASGKPDRVEAKVAKLPASAAPMPIENMELTMVRKSG